MDARTFDRDDASALEARDRRIDFGRRAAECSIHPLALSAVNPPHNLQDDQIFCALHRSESASCLDLAPIRSFEPIPPPGFGKYTRWKFRRWNRARQ
jgi:hypothetical protein